LNKSVASSLLAMHALGNVAAFMSNPDYYLWAIFSVLSLAVCCFLVNRQVAKLVVLSYLAIGLYSFIVGIAFFDHGQLSGVGVFALVLVFPPAFYVVYRVYSSKPSAGDVASGVA
jgi:hypothetical protein